MDHHHPQTCGATELVVEEFFSSEQSSDLANTTTPGRLDRQQHMISLEKSPQTRRKGKIILHTTSLMASE